MNKKHRLKESSGVKSLGGLILSDRGWLFRLKINGSKMI